MRLKDLKNDIIEPVENKCPTDWISPVIIVPKHNSSDIRICIDMRSANEAIMRTRHVTPTIYEIIASVNNCKVLSKIDLKMGYHQLQLDPECRNITTFSTHHGLYRYKRMAFGINSAAEIFQYTIASLINGIKGVRNISDWFKNICYELIVTNDGLLLRKTRLIIPKALQKEALMIAHEGH